jgi:hypothetical protein
MLFGEMVIYVEAWTPNYSIKASKIKEFKKCAPLGTAAQDISMHATNKHFAEARVGEFRKTHHPRNVEV